MTHAQNEYLLELIGVKKHFDVTNHWFGKRSLLKAVDGVDLQVKQGETLGIVGESGCGKSTLGNLIVQLLEPTEGKIIFDGVELGTLTAAQLRKKRVDIQMILQDPFSSLNPRMRVFDIIAEPLRTHKTVAKANMAKEVEELLRVVGLDPSYMNRYPHEFSGGQRQRIGIARALALKPKLIVCDEPVSALDVSIQAQILNLLKKLQQEFQLTYLFIAHGIPAVAYMSDRIGVMYLGKIVELADKPQLMSRPMHPYSQLLLSSVPIVDPHARDPKQRRADVEPDLPSPVDLPQGCRFQPRCPYADEKCKTEAPDLTEQQPGHLVACHYPVQEARLNEAT